ncbi:Txe/YoeB family addiction module toxin [Hanamia caeni]|uniref:Putative mRNA interferase YoeB n=1 Tax=Hanamia caeni TaxID=2294116 RepID=A0A3M9NLX5_9BACT|nr:Txe/YoeB family addiction module toxin [Hanamia caeni]RNI38799.1 Txe/YoeB family addiction module toxin [Hanamia caeni]
MEIVFSPESLEDLNFWKQSGNVKIQNRILQLLESIKESPYEGLGKPEALKHNWTGYWSRRINKEHRLIYKTENERIIIAQLRGHY